MTDLLTTLTARGFVQDATPGLVERLSKGTITRFDGLSVYRLEGAPQPWHSIDLTTENLG